MKQRAGLFFCLLLAASIATGQSLRQIVAAPYAIASEDAKRIYALGHGDRTLSELTVYDTESETIVASFTAPGDAMFRPWETRPISGALDVVPWDQGRIDSESFHIAKRFHVLDDVEGGPAEIRSTDMHVAGVRRWGPGAHRGRAVCLLHDRAAEVQSLAFFDDAGRIVETWKVDNSAADPDWIVQSIDFPDDDHSVCFILCVDRTLASWRVARVSATGESRHLDLGEIEGMAGTSAALDSHTHALVDGEGNLVVALFDRDEPRERRYEGGIAAQGIREFSGTRLYDLRFIDGSADGRQRPLGAEPNFTPMIELRRLRVDPERGMAVEEAVRFSASSLDYLQSGPFVNEASGKVYFVAAGGAEERGYFLFELKSGLAPPQ